MSDTLGKFQASMAFIFQHELGLIAEASELKLAGEFASAHAAFKALEAEGQDHLIPASMMALEISSFIQDERNNAHLSEELHHHQCMELFIKMMNWERPIEAKGSAEDAAFLEGCLALEA